MANKLPLRWDELVPLASSLCLLRELARPHAEKSGPFAQAICEMLDKEDYPGLCSYELSYDLSLADAESYVNARQALAFFSKLEPIEIGLDKRAEAWDKFVKAEEACRETNTRIRTWRSTNGASLRGPVSAVIHCAQRKISKVLGRVPRYDELHFSFGPGASTTVNARASSPRFKLGGRLACSKELANSVAVLLAEAPPWAEAHAVEDNADSWTVNVEIHPGKLQFVPKNAKTYRSIVVEPVLNSFGQKGVGGWLKKRLRFAGVDLSDQSKNQALARLGSVTDTLATLDLSSASDTISKEVVQILVPIDWYDFLSRFRTGEVSTPHGVMSLEKFSSMGNAYTFELESLIFWGLAMGVCETLGVDSSTLSVYGDDIIIDVEGFDLLSEVLDFLGFEVNTRKSFRSGPFRESCGSDWLQGFDIRPYYQKTLVSVETLFTLHNFYMRRFEFEAAARVVRLIPAQLRLFGPDGYGDGHLIGAWSPRLSRRSSDSQWCGTLFDTFAHKHKRTRLPSKGDRVLPAYSIYASDDPENRVDHDVVRGSRGYKRISIYTFTRGIFL